MTSMDTASELLVAGRSACAEKKYRDALGFLHKALTHAAQLPLRLQILDLLVGVYVKLEDLKLAILQAKSMVRADRSDARGYLRCGQIKRLDEDAKAACQWYEQGLKNTKQADRLRPGLQSSLLKCQESIKRSLLVSNASDPMTRLPFEIVTLFLTHLDYKEHTRLLRVCKSWNRVLSGLPPLTNTLDFTGATTKVSVTMLRAATRRLADYPMKLVPASFSNQATHYLNERLKLWSTKPTVQHLATNNPGTFIQDLRLHIHPLRRLILGPSVPLRGVALEVILLNCHTLNELVAHTLTIRVTEVLTFPPNFRQEQLEKLSVSSNLHFSSFEVFPNLTHLEFRRLKQIFVTMEIDLTRNTRLHSATIHGDHIKTTLPPGIEILNLRNKVDCSLTTATKLRHLDFHSDAVRLHTCVGLIKAGVLNNVREFGLTFLPFDAESDREVLTELFGECSRFESIQLNSSILGDAELLGLVDSTPSLRKLEISNAAITGAFLADLLKAPTCQVDSINLKNCRNVSRDTWEWVRQRGIQLSTLSNDGESSINGGQRLLQSW